MTRRFRSPSLPRIPPITAPPKPQALINVLQATPTITWANPADIVYGTALSGTQLNATSSWTVGGGVGSVAGTFTYTPAAGTVLAVGDNQTLSVSFLPADTTDFRSASATVQINVNAAAITTPTLAEGNWIGTYGTQGYEVIGNATSLPSYATVTPSGQATYTWAASTTDPRALQDAGGTGRIAAAWDSATSFTVDVNLTDGQTHDLELYFVDWDSTARSEQVQISNASTGAVLDTETVSSFHSGVYVNCQVSGNVRDHDHQADRCQRGAQRAVHRPDRVGDVPPAGHDDARKLDQYLRHAGL